MLVSITAKERREACEASSNCLTGIERRGGDTGGGTGSVEHIPLTPGGAVGDMTGLDPIGDMTGGMVSSWD